MVGSFPLKPLSMPRHSMAAQFYVRGTVNMTQKIKDIEASLRLCKEMESPSVVIPVSTISKHFPATRHPAYPNVPSYDLGALKEWAKEKGWSITFATTGTKTDRRMVPGIRFSPLNKINSIPDSATNPTANNAEQKHYWYQKPIGIIGIGIIIIILGAIALYIIKTHLGIQLQ